MEALNCPNCGHSFNIEGLAAGFRFVCRCGHPMEVPGATGRGRVQEGGQGLAKGQRSDSVPSSASGRAPGGASPRSPAAGGVPLKRPSSESSPFEKKTPPPAASLEQSSPSAASLEQSGPFEKKTPPPARPGPVTQTRPSGVSPPVYPPGSSSGYHQVQMQMTVPPQRPRPPKKKRRGLRLFLLFCILGGGVGFVLWQMTEGEDWLPRLLSGDEDPSLYGPRTRNPIQTGSPPRGPSSQRVATGGQQAPLGRRGSPPTRKLSSRQPSKIAGSTKRGSPPPQRKGTSAPETRRETSPDGGPAATALRTRPKSSRETPSPGRRAPSARRQVPVVPPPVLTPYPLARPFATPQKGNSSQTPGEKPKDRGVSPAKSYSTRQQGKWTVYDVASKGRSRWSLGKGRIEEKSNIAHAAFAQGLERGSHIVRPGPEGGLLVTAKVRPRCRGTIGLLFGYHGPDKHYRLAFSPGRPSRRSFGEIRLEKCVGGRYLRLGTVTGKLPKVLGVRILHHPGRLVVEASRVRLFEIKDKTYKPAQYGVSAARGRRGVVLDLQAKKYLRAPESTVVDLLHPARGGGVIRVETPLGGLPSSPGTLVDGKLWGAKGRQEWSAPAIPPYRITLAFPEGRVARLRALILQQPRPSSKDAVRLFTVEVASHPKGPFREAGSNVAYASRQGHLFLGNVTARYLRLTLESNHGGSRIRLRGLRVLGELLPAGKRPASLPLPLPPARPAPPKQPRKLLWKAPLTGQLYPGKEDRFSLTVPPQGRTLRLTLKQPRLLQAEVLLYSAKGKRLQRCPPRLAYNRRHHYRLAVKPGRYQLGLRLARPSVVFVVDGAGVPSSLQKSLRQQLQHLLSLWGERLNVAFLPASARKKETPYFAASLQEAQQTLQKVWRQSRRAGVTRWNDSTLAALRWLQERPGLRHLVLLGTGAPDRSQTLSLHLWRELQRRPVRLHTVLQGRGIVRRLASSGVRLERFLVALAEQTGGQSWTRPHYLEACKIWESLRRLLEPTSSYTLTATVGGEEPLQGRLRVFFASPELEATGGLRRLRLIVDRSATMKQKLSPHESAPVTPKKALQEALGEFVQSLPQEVQVEGLFASARRCRSSFRVGPWLGQRKFLSLLRRLPLKGGHFPLRAALEAAVRSPKKRSGPASLLLFTAGASLCPVKIAELGVLFGRPQAPLLQLFHIGQALPERRELLQKIAAGVRGISLQARSTNQLRRFLRLSLQLHYTVYNKKGQPVTTRRVGRAATLPTGLYYVALHTRPVLRSSWLRLRRDTPLALMLRRSPQGKLELQLAR